MKWLALLLLAAAPAAADPRRDYLLHCSGCHRQDGSGLASNGIPDLRDNGRHAAAAPWREYLVQVPGVAQSQLDNARTAALLNWLLAQFAAPLPTDFRPFTAQEVAGYRSRTAHDAPTRRAAILRQLGD